MSREITRSEIRMFLVEDGIYANKKGFEPLVRAIDIYTAEGTADNENISRCTRGI